MAIFASRRIITVMFVPIPSLAVYGSGVGYDERVAPPMKTGLTAFLRSP
jgi:hypothetical protein